MPLPVVPAASDSLPPVKENGGSGGYKAPDVTTQPPATAPTDIHALPDKLRLIITGGDCSAVRAWRAYRSLSSRALVEHGKLNPYTLHAIDCGLVALCEWTVAPIARALRIADGQLLLAQQLAEQAANTPPADPPPPLTPGRLRQK